MQYEVTSGYTPQKKILIYTLLGCFSKKDLNHLYNYSYQSHSRFYYKDTKLFECVLGKGVEDCNKSEVKLEELFEPSFERANYLR